VNSDTVFGGPDGDGSRSWTSGRETVPQCSHITVRYQRAYGAASQALPTDIVGVNVGLMTVIQALARVFAVGLLLIFGTVCRAADLPANDDQPHVNLLTPGDSVTVQVQGQPDVPNVYVGEDGTIGVPLAGNVHVAGLSPADAAARVATALKDGGYFVAPQVTIITQPRSAVVTVLGEVHAVGRFPVNPSTTILDLLAQAGGVNKDTASDEGYVLRRDDSGHINRYPVKLNGLTEIKDVLPTPTLLGGDTLVVPVAENFYVTGEVTTPGKYYIEPGMTVMQAILRAGGINERGSEHRIELKRLRKDGQYEVIHAKSGDLIQANDVIHVKESIF
jgi:polysaccharide export outer membrane protein